MFQIFQVFFYSLSGLALQQLVARQTQNIDKVAQHSPHYGLANARSLLSMPRIVHRSVHVALVFACSIGDRVVRGWSLPSIIEIRIYKILVKNKTVVGRVVVVVVVCFGENI